MVMLEICGSREMFWDPAKATLSFQIQICIKVDLFKKVVIGYKCSLKRALMLRSV